MQISGFLFPENYYFWIMEPNGGIWIKFIKDNKIQLGMSSILAIKLEYIKKLNFLTKNMISEGKPFIKIGGRNLEMILFAPFNAKILNKNSDLTKAELSQENVYNQFWLLELEIDTKLVELKNWYKVPNTNINKYVSAILKREKSLKENCCPNFSKSQIVYRRKTR